LAPFADGWREELARRGFAPHSITAHAQLVAHLSGWMLARGRVLVDLTDDVAREYLRARRDAGYTNRTTARALAPLLGYLRGLGAVPEPGVQVSATPVEILLAEFETFLVDERGLASGSVDHYLRFARVFLAQFEPVPLDAALAGLSGGTVTSFVVAQMRWRSPGDGRSMVTALRSLLRYLHVAGRVPDSLASAVPSVPGWKFGSLPRGVNGAHVAALLSSCDRDNAQGRRDYAILMLLARLGLRAGEVIKITWMTLIGDWALRIVGR
jgi:site-specific recombinase XerD